MEQGEESQMLQTLKKKLYALPLPPSIMQKQDGVYVNEITGCISNVHPVEEYLKLQRNNLAAMSNNYSSIEPKDALNETSSIALLSAESQEDHERRESCPNIVKMDTNGSIGMLENCSQGANFLVNSVSKLNSTTMVMTKRFDHPDNPIPHSLNFTSWWYQQGSVRKHVAISYFPETGSFRVKVKGSSDLIRLSHLPSNKWGIICELDLCIGATLKILGKSLTLRQADLATQGWLEKECARLKQIRDRLCTELSKYFLDYRTSSLVHGGGGGKNEEGPSNLAAAGGLGKIQRKIAATPLRRLRIEVLELFKHIKALRPKLAARLLKEFGPVVLAF